MIAQGAMAFNSLRLPHADPYGVPQILVALKSFHSIRAWRSKAGLYRRDYSKNHNVGLADALIAATAMRRQVPLVTLNQKHFPMLQDVIVPYHKAQANPAPNQGMEPTR